MGLRSERRAGCLDVRKLAGGQLRFYYRYTKSNGQRDRLLIGTGLALTAARSGGGVVTAVSGRRTGSARRDRGRGSGSGPREG